MGCCCLCPDDSPSKVDPKMPENDAISAPHGPREIFVPIKNRSCTDVWAIVVVLALVIGFVFLVWSSHDKGNTDRMWHGYDDCINICSKNNSQKKSPEFEKLCPSEDMTEKKFESIKLGFSGIESRKCVEKCNLTEEIQILNRCIKRIANPKKYEVIIEEFINNAVSDVGLCWREILYSTLIALGTSLAMLIAFRYLVQWVVYIILIGKTLACICGTIYLWMLYHDEQKRVSEENVTEDQDHTKAYRVYAIAMSVWTVIVLLIIIVMRKRIGLVVQLFKETGKALYSMPALLLHPIYTYALIIVLTGWSGYYAVWIESAGDIKQKDQHLIIKKDIHLHIMRWYNVFLLFIGFAFILGCQHMAIATAVARWFFTRDKSKLSLPVVCGMFCVARFHLGTVCFGAMIIAIVQLVRTILAYVQNRLKRYENSFVKAILWCCQCCLWCFETVLKFLTNNAYIETAIYGCSFCTAGRKAFRALTNNVLRVAAINSVGDFVLFLGKVAIVAVTCIFGIHMIEKKEALNYPWIPIAIAGLIAFLIAHCFISVFEMIIDTIFICFCEDCEKNGDEGLYFMSRGLMQYVKNSEKALKAMDKNKKS